MTDAMNQAFAPLANGEIPLKSPELTDNMANLQAAIEKLTEAVSDMGGKERTPVESNITVDIGTAVTPDSEAMTWLADTVADRITPVVEQAIGSDANGY